ncbi:MAG: hypothetical protein WCI90_06420 [Chlorobium sp.]
MLHRLKGAQCIFPLKSEGKPDGLYSFFHGHQSVCFERVMSKDIAELSVEII